MGPRPPSRARTARPRGAAAHSARGVLSRDRSRHRGDLGCPLPEVAVARDRGSRDKESSARLRRSLQFDGAQARLEAAARDLGASEWQVFARVTVPAMRVPIAAALALCFTFSWDEFIVAFLLAGFDSTLPIVIWGLLRTGLDPQTNAAGTLVFLASLLLVPVAELLLSGRERDARA
ncbi:MAG: ABC transporter permease subunit [Geminicoccaceae bacterium]|nr:ABC transporter permease subunit [Geminicoccaceae bacterium]